MYVEAYLDALRTLLDTIRRDQAGNIRAAAGIVADAIAAGGVVHMFGTGHSHMLAEEAFYRAGGLAAVNPILDERLIFLRGALESTRAECEGGLAAALLERESVLERDAAVIASNSGINAAPVEMALEMKARGVHVIAITNLRQSAGSSPRHTSGKRLFEIADVAIDNCVPAGDAVIEIAAAGRRAGAASTVAGAAIVNSIMLEAAAALAARGQIAALFPSANVPGATHEMLADLLRPYKARVRYIDVE
jgi:uncharacterized phosphosugar-binding protein